MEPQTPDEVRPHVNLKRLRRTIREVAAELRQIKYDFKEWNRKASGMTEEQLCGDFTGYNLKERQQTLKTRSQQLSTFSSWLRGKAPLGSIRSTRLKLTEEFWMNAVDRLAEIGFKAGDE